MEYDVIIVGYPYHSTNQTIAPAYLRIYSDIEAFVLLNIWVLVQNIVLLSEYNYFTTYVFSRWNCLSVTVFPHKNRTAASEGVELDVEHSPLQERIP